MAQIADMKAEAQRESEDLLSMIRELSKEVKLQTLIINQSIPAEFQKDMEDHVQWHEETGEWHMVSSKHLIRKYSPSLLLFVATVVVVCCCLLLFMQPGIAYAGNNVKIDWKVPEPFSLVRKCCGKVGFRF